MTAEEYLKQRNTALREKLNKHLLRGMVTNAMESYRKESSKELVEAVQNLLMTPESEFWSIMELIQQLQKALENHLK